MSIDCSFHQHMTTITTTRTRTRTRTTCRRRLSSTQKWLLLLWMTSSSLLLLLLLLLLQSPTVQAFSPRVVSDRWRLQSPRSRRSRSRTRNRIILAQQQQQQDSDNNNQDNTSNNKRHIVVSAQLALDVPIHVAFDAFADLSRQPSWSPWLKSVEYVIKKKKNANDYHDYYYNQQQQHDDDNHNDNDKDETVWKMNRLPIQWRAVQTNLERPYQLAWKSTTGLDNFGKVQFCAISEMQCHMTLTMTFVAPRFWQSLVRMTTTAYKKKKKSSSSSSSSLKKLVEQRILKQTLETFRDIVLQEDLPRYQQEQQQQLELVEQEQQQVVPIE